MADSAIDLKRIRKSAYPLLGRGSDYDRLMEWIGESRFVLLGEASHGTHEFYRERARITKRLIHEKGFIAVAVEADWPDAYRINRYVQGMGEAGQNLASLAGFRRFPTWMWRNTDVLDFVGWLRRYNDSAQSGGPKVGFYGLDLYSLHASIEAVIKYLERVDPKTAWNARRRYGCFDHFGNDPRVYGYSANLGSFEQSCEKDVVDQLVELQYKAVEYVKHDGYVAEEEYFFAEQNARVAKNAEEYYRAMFRGGDDSWNLRDSHMTQTVHRLLEFLKFRAGVPKIVIWGHNSHIGDARATAMSRRGEHNVGQLLRESYADDTRLIGFTTYSGTVTAASDWDAPTERKRVRPALSNSYEALFHAVGIPNFVLNLREESEATAVLKEPRLERAIGVIYLPRSERISHYFQARLTEQFDTVLHLDESHAVEPLEATGEWHEGELPETYPHAV